MKTKKSKKLALALAGLLFTASLSSAAVINEWDQAASGATYPAPTNVATPDYVFDQYNYVEPGYLMDPNTGAVSEGGFMPSGWAKYVVGSIDLVNGAMTWKERDTQGPGLSIVTGDDVTNQNCIMSAGWNPDSTVVLDPDGFDVTGMADWWGIDKKQCSDPWQSSKRFKVVSRTLDAPLDLTFNVTDNGAEDVYRVLQKYGNQTGSRVTGYTQQLGFIDENGVFTEAEPGQGLAYTFKSGIKHSNVDPTPSTMANQGELDSLIAHGLFGAPDKHHTAAGYYNPYVRANFGLLAGETHITTTGMHPVHTSLVGEWIPSNSLPGAYYFDMDGIVYTDNALMATCEGTFDEEAGAADPVGTNAGCDGTWVTYRSSYVPVDNGDGTWTIPASSGIDPLDTTLNRTEIPADVLAAWANDPLWIPGAIDDFANVNINSYISVGNVSAWPTASVDADGNTVGSFTMRITPTFDQAVADANDAADDTYGLAVSIEEAATTVQ